MSDLLPPHGELPGLRDCAPTEFLTKLRRETTALNWFGLCLGGVVWLISPIVTIHVPLPALLLSASARDRHIHALGSTRFYLLRQAFVLLKMYACMCWGQDSAVRQQLNLAAYPVDPGTFRTS